MKKKGEKPADTYIVMGDIPCPMHVAHYIDILQKNKTCYLLVGAVDADGIIHHVRCPLRLAYDLPVCYINFEYVSQGFREDFLLACSGAGKRMRRCQAPSEAFGRSRLTVPMTAARKR